MKKILFLLVGLLTSVSLFAYDDFDIIEGTAPISLPTEALIVNNQPMLCDRMTWEIDDFGELGKTVRMIPTFSGETLQYLKSQDMLQSFNFFCLGENLFASYEGDGYICYLSGKCGKAHYMCRVGYEGR